MALKLPLQDDDPDVSLEEIIFSCEVCQATVSEVYATKEQHHGFHSGSSHDSGNGIVAKLWIGECSHVFCGIHLEGGGVAFHRKDAAPRAGCPVCPKDEPTSQSQDIFAIRGLKPGEYDEIIPESWLRCPPTRLDAHDVEMDALRFQYRRLASYSTKVNKAWKTAESKRRVMEATLSNERKQWRKHQAETKEALKKRDALIEERDAKLKKWDGRKEVINHYMSIVGPMAKDLAEMRALLVELGCQVPERDYSYRPKPTIETTRVDDRTQQTDSSTTLVGSNTRTSSALRKRKANNDAYADSQEQGIQDPLPPSKIDQASMMPPPLPKTRPARRHDQSAPRSTAQIPSQRRDLSPQSGIKSLQQHADPRTQQPAMSQRHHADYSRQTSPQTREQSLEQTRQTLSHTRQERPYTCAEQGPPSRSSVQLYGIRGWQDQSLHRSVASTRGGVNGLDQMNQTKPPLAPQALPYRDTQAVTSDPRTERLEYYGHPPPREVALHQTSRHRGGPTFTETGNWPGEGLSAPYVGRAASRSSQAQPVGSQQIERPQPDAPFYRQSRQTYRGHNGTTTLSSEFRAQETATTAQHQPGLLAQPPRLRTSQRTPFSTAGSNAYLQNRSDAPFEATYFDSVYGALAQQSGEDAPREMEGFRMSPPPARTSTRVPLDDGFQYRLSTPAQRKHLEPPAASSVVSPFFGQPSRRQPKALQREQRNKFSYAPPPSSTRGGGVDRYQGSNGLLPPSSSYTQMPHGMQSRGPSFVSSATGARAPPQARPRERMSLPSGPGSGSSRMSARGGVSAVRGSAYEPRSLFSGAGPTRRSVRR